MAFFGSLLSSIATKAIPAVTNVVRGIAKGERLGEALKEGGKEFISSIIPGLANTAQQVIPRVQALVKNNSNLQGIRQYLQTPEDRLTNLQDDDYPNKYDLFDRMGRHVTNKDEIGSGEGYRLIRDIDGIFTLDDFTPSVLQNIEIHRSVHKSRDIQTREGPFGTVIEEPHSHNVADVLPNIVHGMHKMRLKPLVTHIVNGGPKRPIGVSRLTEQKRATMRMEGPRIPSPRPDVPDNELLNPAKMIAVGGINEHIKKMNFKKLKL